MGLGYSNQMGWAYWIQWGMGLSTALIHWAPRPREKTRFHRYTTEWDWLCLPCDHQMRLSHACLLTSISSHVTNRRDWLNYTDWEMNLPLMLLARRCGQGRLVIHHMWDKSLPPDDREGPRHRIPAVQPYPAQQTPLNTYPRERECTIAWYPSHLQHIHERYVPQTRGKGSACIHAVNDSYVSYTFTPRASYYS